MIMTFNTISNIALSQISNCEYDIHWFTTKSSHRIWGTIFVWIFFLWDYLLTRIRVYICPKKNKKESTFLTLIYQMIMTFNAVSNFAFSQMSNCEYNDIHWFTTMSSHRIWGTIFVWIFFSSNYLLTRIQKCPWFSCNNFLTRIWKIGVGVYIKLKALGLKFPSSTLQDDKFQPIHWSFQTQSMIYG